MCHTLPLSLPMKPVSRISTDISPQSIASMEVRIGDVFQRTQRDAEYANNTTRIDADLLALRNENESAFLRAVLGMKKDPAQEMVRQMIVRSISKKVRDMLNGNDEV